MTPNFIPTAINSSQIEKAFTLNVVLEQENHPPSLRSFKIKTDINIQKFFLGQQIFTILKEIGETFHKASFHVFVKDAGFLKYSYGKPTSLTSPKINNIELTSESKVYVIGAPNEYIEGPYRRTKSASDGDEFNGYISYRHLSHLIGPDVSAQLEFCDPQSQYLKKYLYHYIHGNCWIPLYDSRDQRQEDIFHLSPKPSVSYTQDIFPNLMIISDQFPDWHWSKRVDFIRMFIHSSLSFGLLQSDMDVIERRIENQESPKISFRTRIAQFIQSNILQSQSSSSSTSEPIKIMVKEKSILLRFQDRSIFRIADIYLQLISSYLKIRDAYNLQHTCHWFNQDKREYTLGHITRTRNFWQLILEAVELKHLGSAESNVICYFHDKYHIVFPLIEKIQAAKTSKDYKTLYELILQIKNFIVVNKTSKKTGKQQNWQSAVNKLCPAFIDSNLTVFEAVDHFMKSLLKPQSINVIISTKPGFPKQNPIQLSCGGHTTIREIYILTKQALKQRNIQLFQLAIKPDEEASIQKSILIHPSYLPPNWLDTTFKSYEWITRTSNRFSKIINFDLLQSK